MKKRFISIILALCTICSICGSAFATENALAAPRAVTVPTSYAPDSWYGVEHEWTARYYTYSSYIFDISKSIYIDARADQPFSVEIYRPDGSQYYTDTAFYDSDSQQYKSSITLYHPAIYGDLSYYYIILRNNSSTPITQNAYYEVWGSTSYPDRAYTKNS